MDTPTSNWMENMLTRRRAVKLASPAPTGPEMDAMQIRQHWNLNRLAGQMGSAQLQQEQTDSMPSKS